jgi:hypothetical protein
MTHSFSAMFKEVPSPDPLAYVMGYTHAVTGQHLGKGKHRKHLAEQYVEGFKLGMRVKHKRIPQPKWAREIRR